MASNLAGPELPEPSSASAGGHERRVPEGRLEPSSHGQSGAGAPPAGERFGPLTLVRSAKEDGRQLILYAHDREA
jgi:hypothetical protein